MTTAEPAEVRVDRPVGRLGPKREGLSVKLTFEQHDYPNPKYKWCVVKLDGQEIGRCEMDSEGRLVPRGGRKAREPGEIGLLLVRNMLADARKRKSAALADWFVFSRMRGSWLRRANASNVAGAAVDSLVFPLAAGFPLVYVPLQFMAKVLGGALWTAVLARSAQRASA